MPKCIVTGGAGFIGSHLTDRLVELGHEVHVIDNLMLGKKEFVNPKAVFHQIDIRDEVELEKVFIGAEVVFHEAADPRLQVSIEDPVGTHEVNVTGTLNVLVAAKNTKVKKVIFASSCATYGDVPLPISETAVQEPLSPYGLHKKMGEEYCRLFSQLYGLETVCLRYFNVFGPRKLDTGSYPMVIPTFLGQIKRGEVMTIVGDGEQTRDYVHVDDVVRANIQAWQEEVSNGEPINIGSGRQVSVNEVARAIGGESKNIPARAGEMRHIEANVAKAKTLLKWESTISIEEGIDALKKEWGIS
ncbi:MAG TPA: NAD-dependent epimerase/dehydratase family protein [Candidatus Magasanikbacteria bacterium]|nr:NAD-dependent epimerase/dehydratase family protein [Candidatus Magasanikbacteria bacterium]